jgi:hypothetical protein
MTQRLRSLRVLFLKPTFQVMHRHAGRRPELRFWEVAHARSVRMTRHSYKARFRVTRAICPFWEVVDHSSI